MRTSTSQLRPRTPSVLLSAVVAVVLLVACEPDDAPVDPEDPDPDEEAIDPDPDDDPPDAVEDEEPDEEPDDEPDEEPDEPDPDHEPDLSVELTLTEVAGMSRPIAGAVGPDGVLHLAERAGTVHRLEDVELSEPVIDISGETTVDGERGLLGLAFADDGSELYLSFTDTDGHTVIEAIAVEDGEVVPDDRRTVFTLEQPYGNHNGGDIHIGPDGYLYVGLGDGGSAGDPLEAGQDTSTLLGSMLRIDASDDPYAIPDDNPFVDDPDAADEIWAFGLRNPWRFSFDRRTDDLWIADVGQDAREEINVMPAGEGAGANYGWNLMEGTLEYAGPEPDDHVPPVHEYDTGQRCAITGGFVYRGEAIPELVGAYLFSDYCEALVRAIVVEDGEVVDEADLGLQGSQHVSFAQDADGELYVLDFDGTVSRIDPA
jgi:glucose/arabinose dehydrogenase